MLRVLVERLAPDGRWSACRDAHWTGETVGDAVDRLRRATIVG